MAARDDIELMQHADGELDERQTSEVEGRLEGDADARAKVQSLGQIGELVRSHLELAADGVSARKFDAIWRTVDNQTSAAPEAAGVWARITGWLERHRGHLFTGVVSAGAVAALALVLRPDARVPNEYSQSHAIDVRPVALREAPEIESLDTPDGTSTVLNLEDEDGHMAVIWVSPADTVEGI